MTRNIYRNLVFDSADSSGGDCLTLFGPDQTDIYNCTFDLSEAPVESQDEAISLVRGAKVCIHDSLIVGSIKAILAGNGEYPEEDAERGHLEMHNCIILGAGRRCPEAQDGVRVYMKNCWIADWGLRFDTRAFGAWAHKNASITAIDCLFTQSVPATFDMRRWVVDHMNHIGQAVNDSGFSALFKAKTYVSGFRRALTADDGGAVTASNCYRNSPKIIIENCSDYMDYDSALNRAVHITRRCGLDEAFVREYFTDLENCF